MLTCRKKAVIYCQSKDEEVDLEFLYQVRYLEKSTSGCYVASAILQSDYGSKEVISIVIYLQITELEKKQNEVDIVQLSTKSEFLPLKVYYLNAKIQKRVTPIFEKIVADAYLFNASRQVYLQPNLLTLNP